MRLIQFLQISKVRRKDSGFTITEVMVAGLMSTLILGGSMELSNSLRKMVVQDQTRIQMNQNLRTSLDLIGQDVRQAGERLSSTDQAVQVINGSGSDPDTLTLSSDTGGLPKLPLCAPINSGSSRDNVDVADNLSPNSPNYRTACDKANRDSNDSGNWPDDLEQWKDYRVNNGSVVYAYIYDPTTNVGEFFTYDDEDSSGTKLHRANGTAWANNYTTNAYVVLGYQRKTYRLVNNPSRVGDRFLELTINDATNNGVTKKLANRLADFQVQAWMPNDTTAKTNFPSVTSGGTTTTYSWQGLENLEVKLKSTTPSSNSGISTSNLTTTGKFLPRNTLSDVGD
jgi:Tfp pilus assembly protein PilW